MRQRLAALTGAATPTLALREASGGASQWSWGVRGSFSQFYFRDQSTTRFVDASQPDIDPEVDNSVNLNQLLSNADISLTGGSDRNQLLLRAAAWRPRRRTRTAARQPRAWRQPTALRQQLGQPGLDAGQIIERQVQAIPGLVGQIVGRGRRVRSLDQRVQATRAVRAQAGGDHMGQPLLAVQLLHALDGVALVMQQGAHAAQHGDVLRPVESAAAGPLHRADERESRFPETQHMLGHAKFVGGFGNGPESLGPLGHRSDP